MLCVVHVSHIDLEKHGVDLVVDDEVKVAANFEAKKRKQLSPEKSDLFSSSFSSPGTPRMSKEVSIPDISALSSMLQATQVAAAVPTLDEDDDEFHDADEEFYDAE